MAERERLITQQWDLVRDAEGNTLAMAERAPGTPVRGVDLAQMLASLNDAQRKLGAAQTMDTLELRRALATTHNTLADMHNRADAKFTAFVRNHVKTNQRLDQVIADQQASNALVADTARKMAEVAAGLQRILEQTKATQDRMAARSMKVWIADPGNQLVCLAGAIALGVTFIVVRVVMG